MRSRQPWAFTLIELLVVVAIIAILMAVFLPRLIGGSTSVGKRAQAPMSAARDTVCQSNLHQIRMAIDVAKQGNDDERPPQSLAELKFPAETLRCPEGGEPYVYNPQTGEVHCPHPGHEKL